MNSIERQKALYEYLISKGNEYTYQEDIAHEMVNNGVLDYYNHIACCQHEYHEANERKILTNDIREINSSSDFEKIIISNGNGVKIATEEDYDKMIKSLYKAVFAKLKRIRTIEKKAKRNGQITLDKKEIIAFLENE